MASTSRVRLVSHVPRYDDQQIERAWALSTSERNAAACALRHYYSYSERLRGLDDQRPLRFGTAFHEVIEGVFRHFAETDTPVSDEQVRALLDETLSAWRANARLLAATSSEEIEEDAEALTNAILGWLRTYGAAPWRDFEVIAVERSFSAPILHPRTGTPLRSKMLVVEEQHADGPRLRPAGGGEAPGARTVQWPWVFVGRVDAILRHRTTGAVWLLDHKTSASPETFASGLSGDPQANGYAWLVEQAIRSGALLDVGVERDARLAGFVYNIVSSSRQRKPEVLKKGGLSRAKSVTPSWLYEEAIRENGLALTDYDEHVETLRTTVDRRLYLAEWVSVGREERDRFAREVYADAVRISGLYREAARANSVLDLALSHPRTPVCRLPGGYCSYRGPCSQDGAEARSNYAVADGVYWSIKGGASSAAPVNIQPNEVISW
jgi:hypothetical protein